MRDTFCRYEGICFGPEAGHSWGRMRELLPGCAAISCQSWPHAARGLGFGFRVADTGFRNWDACEYEEDTGYYPGCEYEWLDGSGKRHFPARVRGGFRASFGIWRGCAASGAGGCGFWLQCGSRFWKFALPQFPGALRIWRKMAVRAAGKGRHV